MKKRILGGLTFLAVVIILAGSLYAPFAGKWVSSETDFWKIATIGEPPSGDWTPYFESFPKSYKFEIYHLDEAEGMKWFVQLPSGNKEDILLIYTSPSSYSLWDTASYFIFEGGSIYSEFDAPKLDGRYMRETYGEDKVFDEINNYVFPSEDHAIFIIKFELDTSMENQLVIHEIDFASGGRDRFTKDIQHFKDNTKVPLPGTGGLKLTPSTFNKATTKKIEFEFTAPEDLPAGYNVSIMSEPVTSDDVEDLLKKVEDGSIGGTGFTLFEYTGGVSANHEAKGTIEGSNEIKTLQDFDNGKYLVFVDKTGTATVQTLAGSIVEIKGEVPATPCDKCATILECLACVDKAFVEGVFK